VNVEGETGRFRSPDDELFECWRDPDGRLVPEHVRDQRRQLQAEEAILAFGIEPGDLVRLSNQISPIPFRVLEVSPDTSIFCSACSDLHDAGGLVLNLQACRSDDPRRKAITLAGWRREGDRLVRVRSACDADLLPVELFLESKREATAAPASRGPGDDRSPESDTPNLDPGLSRGAAPLEVDEKRQPATQRTLF
jgi:hypothetical protein